MDGEPLSAERFVEVYGRSSRTWTWWTTNQPVRLSFFEVLVAMAFAAFADAPVDVAVIEVGMGGTWDNTNVADGAVAVVTPISIDHAAVPRRHGRGDRRRQGGHHQARCRGRARPAAGRGRR